MEWQSEELEKVNCDFCENPKAEHVFTRPDGLEVVECVNCGLCYLSPRPKASLINRLYEKDYFSRPADNSKLGFVDYFSETRQKITMTGLMRKLKVISSHLALSGKKCLEIGCASGEFCNILNEAGADVVGIDLSKFIIEEAEKRYKNLAFRHGGIEIISKDEYFDVIFAFEVIEHVLTPGKFMADITRHLKPEGKVVLSTPNYESAKNIGKEYWYGFNDSFEHIYFFSPLNLRKYASQYGLTVEAWYTGEGAGVCHESAPEKTTKKMLRNILISLGILSIARKLYTKVFKSTDEYIPRGKRHNLLMVLSKSN